MRSITDLYKNAEKFWPSEIAELEQASSIIPKLLATQDAFISLLTIADSSPMAWIDALKTSKSLPANLFLKHLMVLSDIGGEKLMRFKRELPDIFVENKMEYVWEEDTHEYILESLAENGRWSNAELSVDGDGLVNAVEISQAMQDVIMLLLFGGSAVSDLLPEEIQDKCIIGTMLGNSEELDSFVKQRYIWVSRITGGAQANTMGQLAQTFVLDYLKEQLPDEWDWSSKQIPEVTQNNRTLMAFDIVAQSPNGNYCAIEVSFQVTTNSTIERKAGQAKTRANMLHRRGHKIAYVIDGAGNFQRESALKTISRYSDCIVTFKRDELQKLADFLPTLDEV